MGSPLGVLFAEMYMAKIEAQTFHEIPRPKIYCRFRDDIATVVEEEVELEHLAAKLKEKSVLNFTIERSIDNKIPYLDVADSHSR